MPLKFADPDIERILRTYHLDELHASDDTIYALQPDLTLVYVNRGWSKFANENDGLAIIQERWPIGSSILDAIPVILQPFFADKFSQCLESGSPWQHRYECSSPNVYREFLMTTYPIGDRQGLLVVHSLCRDSPHNRSSEDPIEELYRNSDGTILQCVQCRRVKRSSTISVWDWVPEWLHKFPANISHGLCEPCFDYLYPGGSPMFGGYPKMIRTDHRSSQHFRDAIRE